ncbi:MAG: DUF6089 family protein [Crocinitomicaceae bacterium]|nr:DUF6089 family protein [Crocinitomicaceae bacterium]
MKLNLNIFFALIASISFAQKQTILSRSEIGVLLGGSYYIGDLNQYNHFKNTQPALSLLYRFNINSRVSWRVNVSYGSVRGSDENAKNEVLRNRNLSFSSNIFEAATGVEFNYFPFQLGHPRYLATAYLLAEIGVFTMNPKAEFDGETYELQPLGTEGQNSELSSKGNYSRTQLTIPLGFGVKASLGPKVSIGLEYAIRKTFTDYLDDVGGNRYVPSVALEEANGPLAAAMANRSLDQSDFGKRGNARTKDWYSFFGATFTFRIGSPKKCAQPGA